MPYASAVVSTLFRFSAYVFLRVIPTPLGLAILPALYALYATSLWIWSPRTSVSTETTEPNSVRSKISNYICAILLSLPTAAQPLRITNFVLNTLLLLAAVEFVLYPVMDTASTVVFTRVGAVYHDRVKIQIRYPQLNIGENTLRVVWRESKNMVAKGDSWTNGPVFHLTQENDWVDIVNLGGLSPKTEYEYMLAINKTILPYPSSPIRFRTFPDPHLPSGNRFRFIVSSCVLPNFPYVPFQSRTIKGFDLLAHNIFPTNAETPTSVPSPYTERGSTVEFRNGLPPESLNSALQPWPVDFLLLLGDFIYADVPAYFGDDLESYRRLYRRNYQSKSFRKIYERLPIFNTYDDHEVINNFAGQGYDSTPPFPNASDAFNIYSALANYDPPDRGHYYYDFRHGDVAFFIMDTRRYRSIAMKDSFNSHTMLGGRQLTALYKWLGKVNQTSTVKFIVTSVPFTALWGHDATTDSWAGYTDERTRLLTAMHSVPNVIILSGDRHEFAHIEYNSAGQSHRIQEFSTSPLSMFYIPFFRTLQAASREVFTRPRPNIHQTNATEEMIDITEDVPRERVIEYIANGNYKWSSIEVDTTLDNPVVRLEVMIDGSAAYHLSIVGTPVKRHSSTALGALIPSSFNDILDRMGIKPFQWF